MTVRTKTPPAVPPAIAAICLSSFASGISVVLAEIVEGRDVAVWVAVDNVVEAPVA